MEDTKVSRTETHSKTMSKLIAVPCFADRIGDWIIMIKILLVEDDPGLARGVQVNLETEGYKVYHSPTIGEAITQTQKEDLSLIILDLGLPDGHGFDYLKKIRGEGSHIPVVILTAQTDEDSVVSGLQLGANDYMRKPFGHKELLARIKSLLRTSNKKDCIVRFDNLVLSLDQRLVKYADQTIELNRREFDILKYFVENAENIVTRESLLAAFDKDGEIFDRTIDSHISHLRGKFRKAEIEDIKISSVYGIGYRLERT